MNSQGHLYIHTHIKKGNSRQAALVQLCGVGTSCGLCRHPAIKKNAAAKARCAHVHLSDASSKRPLPLPVEDIAYEGQREKGCSVG